MKFDELSEETRTNLIREAIAPIDNEWYTEVVDMWNGEHKNGLKITNIVVDVEDDFIDFDLSISPIVFLNQFPEVGMSKHAGLFNFNHDVTLVDGCIRPSLLGISDMMTKVSGQLYNMHEGIGKKIMKDLTLLWSEMDSNEVKITMLQMYDYDVNGNVLGGTQ